MSLVGKNLPILLSTLSAITVLGCGGSPPVARVQAPSDEPAPVGDEVPDQVPDDVPDPVPDDVPDDVPEQVPGGEPPPPPEAPKMWEMCGPTARLVKDINPGTPGPLPGELTHGNNLLVFAADDGGSGRELWASTGSGAGTKLLKDVFPGATGSSPELFTWLGDTVFFTANDGTAGRELWKTDGTESGTELVADIRPGAAGSEPEHLTVFQGVLYFTADDGVHGRELWRSDGTEKGTVLLRDFTPVGDFTSTGFALAATKKDLYVRVFLYSPSDIEGSRAQLWRTDGTAAGFGPVLEVPDNHDIRALTPFEDRLFFLLNRDEPETSLHLTDGTPAGTRLVYEFLGAPRELTVLNGRLYLAAGTAVDGSGVLDEELWRTDGTPEGTARVKDIRPGLTAAEPKELRVVGNHLFFTADDGTAGRELWRSDGTAAGTVLSDDLEPGPAGSSPEALASIGGHLFFSASTTAAGREAWMSTGGVGEAAPLEEVAPGPESSEPLEFVRSGWDVFFSADDRGPSGRELRAVRFRPVGQCD